MRLLSTRRLKTSGLTSSNCAYPLETHRSKAPPAENPVRLKHSPETPPARTARRSGKLPSVLTSLLEALNARSGHEHAFGGQGALQPLSDESYVALLSAQAPAEANRSTRPRQYGGPMQLAAFPPRPPEPCWACRAPISCPRSESRSTSQVTCPLAGSL